MKLLSIFMLIAFVSSASAIDPKETMCVKAERRDLQVQGERQD